MKTELEQIVGAFMAADDQRKANALLVLRGEARGGGPGGGTGTVETFLTLRGVGKALGVSPCTLWRWGVPGHELAGRRRFKLSEVQAYLATEAFHQRAADLRERRHNQNTTSTHAQGEKI